MRAALPEKRRPAEAAGEPTEPHPIRVAIVGRPNAGKSTLINRLIGEERLLTAPEAGTTRDSIAVDLDWQGRNFRLYDTAGLRRRSRVDEKLEKLSVADALNAVRFAEVVVVLLDVESAFEEQDQRIADLVEQEGRAIVIAVNKWDLKEKTGGRDRQVARAGRREADPAQGRAAGGGFGPDRRRPRPVDAGHRRCLRGLEQTRADQRAQSLVRTRDQRASAAGGFGRAGCELNYITQAKSRPPSFVVFCTRADAVPDAYKRYLVNSCARHSICPARRSASRCVKKTTRSKAAQSGSIERRQGIKPAIENP